MCLVEQGFQLLGGQVTPQRPGGEPALRNGPRPQVDSVSGLKSPTPGCPGDGQGLVGRRQNMPPAGRPGGCPGEGVPPRPCEGIWTFPLGLTGLRVPILPGLVTVDPKPPSGVLVSGEGGSCPRQHLPGPARPRALGKDGGGASSWPSHLGGTGPAGLVTLVQWRSCQGRPSCREASGMGL